MITHSITGVRDSASWDSIFRRFWIAVCTLQCMSRKFGVQCKANNCNSCSILLWAFTQKQDILTAVYRTIFAYINVECSHHFTVGLEFTVHKSKSQLVKMFCYIRVEANYAASVWRSAQVFVHLTSEPYADEYGDEVRTDLGRKRSFVVLSCSSIILHLSVISTTSLLDDPSPTHFKERLRIREYAFCRLYFRPTLLKFWASEEIEKA